MEEIPLSLYRGDSRKYKVTVTNTSTGAVQSIIGANIKFSVKKKISDTGYIIQKTEIDPTQIELTDPVNGEFKVFVLPGDTENKTPGVYEYDCQLTTNGEVYTILRGKFTIKQDVTRP